MRRAAHIDKNQPEIVKALRQAGAVVESLAMVGRGLPDLLVGFRGRTFLIEVKNPERKGGKENARGTQARQEGWRAAWRGEGVYTVYDPAQALYVIGATSGSQLRRLNSADAP